MPMDRAQMLDAFLDVLSSNGIRLQDPAAIIIDGEKHRAKVEGDKKTNLVYQIYPDERPAGWFDYYKGGVADTFVLQLGSQYLTPEDDTRLIEGFEISLRAGESLAVVRHNLSEPEEAHEME